MLSPQISPTVILEELNRFSRVPFREILARALGTEPTPQALHKFAQKYPDRWSQYVSTVARLAGFTDKIEIDSSVHLIVAKLSDLELLNKIKEIENQLNSKKEIDVTPLESPEAIDNKDDLKSNV